MGTIGQSPITDKAGLLLLYLSMLTTPFSFEGVFEKRKGVENDMVAFKLLFIRLHFEHWIEPIAIESKTPWGENMFLYKLTDNGRDEGIKYKLMTECF